MNEWTWLSHLDPVPTCQPKMYLFHYFYPWCIYVTKNPLLSPRHQTFVYMLAFRLNFNSNNLKPYSISYFRTYTTVISYTSNRSSLLPSYLACGAWWCWSAPPCQWVARPEPGSWWYNWCWSLWSCSVDWPSLCQNLSTCRVSWSWIPPFLFIVSLKLLYLII